MNPRTYLSIGDVLSLLREEFPDVTISKIRFLESQGLVNPERSPSGYRKFYEQDVERLRWVLRQQREHFLPLKVIRDRLDQETEGALAAAASSRKAAASPAVQPTPVTAAVVAGAGALGASGVAEHVRLDAGPARVNGGPRPVRSGEPAMAGAAGTTGSAGSAGAGGTAARSVGPSWVDPPAAGRSRAVDPAVPSQGAERHVPPAVPTAVPTQGAERHVPPAVPAPEQPARPSPRREPPPSGAAPVQSPRVPGPPGSSAAGTADASYPVPAGFSGASLTLEELCTASGLSASEVASIEGFGLVEPMVVAGVAYYDEEAMVVAKLVASYRRYGIEPRHLRLYHNAVDREMGLVEQVVTPLLRQRNPEARQRATDTAADLAKLGQQLRGSLLRRELRRQLGS